MAVDGRNSTTPTNVAPTQIPQYLELIYNDTPTVDDGYEIPRVIPARSSNKNTPTSETVDRPRTFSTSSTVSDSSATTPVLYQHANLLNNDGESPVKPDSILVIGNIKANGCLAGIRKSVPDLRRNGEKDLSSLEQLLPTVKNCSNTISLSVGGNAASDKSGVNNNIKTNIAYSNVVKQPLLEEELGGNTNEKARNLSNDVASSVSATLNYAHTTPSS